MNYKLYKTDVFKIAPDAVVTVGVSPEISFIFDPANTDYQAFLKWLEEGNQPLPAEE